MKRILSLCLLCLMVFSLTGCANKRAERELSFFDICYGMSRKEVAYLEETVFHNDITKEESDYDVYGGDPNHRYGGENRHVYYFDQAGKLESISFWGFTLKELTKELGEHDEVHSTLKNWYYWYGNINGIPTTIRLDTKTGETFMWNAIGEK